MAKRTVQIDDKLHWYKDAIIYELHIKAFRDGNSDGIGDFKGLMEKLDYLQELGVTAIWLLPFYPSPLRDDGYDIADYYSINPAYGEIEQFKQLLDEAHKRGLKIITELVINHTSDQHPWFQRARRAPVGSPERQYYVWTDDPKQYKDARIIFQDFEKSNWTWDPVAKQYYWHRFFHHQPDLNYDNPKVQAEVFKMIDYWCAMGVDGFRLDAVPYLFERDGTNCENLPETHKFLKKLRKHVDIQYPGTLLLAEANMWPEDSASYFGKGDECHMNYHFPIMPRMFMALQMEDRYPITDIFDQTPAIPDTCQWAIFLRNHDELTLEMVTDEERDYMYKVYVKDPKARINLGIRHRLAPLMENNRRKIELMNYLLFSLPGTPVIYYGDEIGMGDNFYLGDRDGVRTPMQWDGERNAGFSEANPQKLYLPVIQDPLYHYEHVNVEMALQDTSSLLWFMKRLINTRKRYKVFSRGEMKFVNADNAKVLAFTRSYQDELLLVVVNLSRFSQPAELDLNKYKDYSLTEIFSNNGFPGIKSDIPYFLTLSPYECQWYLLKNTDGIHRHRDSLFTMQLKQKSDWLNPTTIEELESSILPEYLAKIRWFGGKGRSLYGIEITEKIVLEESKSVLLLIETSYKSGLPETYQLIISAAYGEAAEHIKTTSPKAVLCELTAENEKGIIYDALYNPSFQQELITRMAENYIIPLPRDEDILFSGKLQQEDVADLKSKILSAEQSNSSIVYGNSYFLKIYRKVDRSINPDLEITRFLTEQTNFRNIPAYVGSIQYRTDDGAMVLAMMQRMVENNIDGWSYMLDKLNSFNEKILSSRNGDFYLPPAGDDILHLPKYDGLENNLRELLDTTVTERVHLLGLRTGEMHLALASSQDDPAFKPEPFSLHYQRSLFSSFQTLVRNAFQSLAKTINRLPDDVRQEAAELLGMKDAVLDRLRHIYARKFDIDKIRIHGDYHLGQVLFTGKDVCIIDFEGEPARSYSERRLKRAALKDVAGMIRSFHYASYGSLLLNNSTQPEDQKKLIPQVEQWQRYMTGFYLQAYLDTVKNSVLIPTNEQDLDTLLQTYILEKAIYELQYELNNRPDWVQIPIRGIRAIMDTENK